MSLSTLSPSGKGFHILFKVDPSKIPKNEDGTKINEKYYQKNTKIDIECYIGGLTNRFFTFTEDVIVDKPINDCTEQLPNFLDKYMLKETKETTVADSDITDDICDYIIENIKKVNKLKSLINYIMKEIFQSMTKTIVQQIWHCVIF